VALATIANLAAVATAAAAAAEAREVGAPADGAAAEPCAANFALRTVQPAPAPLCFTTHRMPPPPLPLPHPNAAQEGYRALPRLCVSLSVHAPASATKRALGALVGLLNSPSLDAAAALSLLAAYGGVDRLAALAAAEADSQQSGGGDAGERQSSRALVREGALVSLGLVYRLGGAALVLPHLGLLTPPAVALLTAAEQRERAVAAFFWASATTSIEAAAALAKATVPLARLDSDGARTPRAQTFTSGLGAARRLAQSPGGGRAALLAAGAVAHVLQHRAALGHLWTSAPEALSYLVRLSAEEETELLALPEALRQAEELRRAGEQGGGALGVGRGGLES